MTTGDDRALELRDMALTVVRRRGKPGRGLASFDGYGFRILYRSQFDQLVVVHEPTEQEKYSAAAKGEPPPVESRQKRSTCSSTRGQATSPC